MADHVLSAMIQISTQDAVDQLKKLNEETKKGGKDSENMSTKMQMGLMKASNTLSGMGAIAGGVFSKMAENAPSLQVALTDIDVIMYEVYRTLGELLAPLIEEHIIPVIEDLVEWFMNLDPEVQTMIATTIGLFTAAGMLAPVLATIATLIGLISLPVILVAAAIVFLIAVFTQDFLGLGTLLKGMFESDIKPMFKEFVDKIKVLWEAFKKMWVIIEPIVAFIAKILAEFLVDKIKSAFDFIMASIDALIEIFDGFSKFFSSIFAGDMDGAVEGLKQIFSGFLNFFTATWDYALDGIKNFVGMLLNIFDNLFGTNLKEYADMIFDWVFGWTDVVRSVITGVFDGIVDNIKHGIEGLVSVFTGFGDMIKQLFAGDIVGAAMSFIDIIKTIINMPIHFINDIVITPLKSVLAAVSDAVDKIPAVDNPHWEESISYIPTLHGGGYIGGHGDQQINGEGGEWMLSRTDVRRMGGIAGVQSARMGGGGGTTNNYFSVTAKVSSDFDIDQLAKKLSRKMEQQAQRRGKF